MLTHISQFLLQLFLLGIPLLQFLYMPLNLMERYLLIVPTHLLLYFIKPLELLLFHQSYQELFDTTVISFLLVLDDFSSVVGQLWNWRKGISL